jgi:cytochrome bd ubiquinol oxidase subunit II
MDALTLHCLHFAFTVTYHYLFSSGNDGTRAAHFHPETKALRGNALSLYAMICAAAGLYPYVLPASNPQSGLTISWVASSPESMTLALYWWIPGMILVGLYTYFVYSRFMATNLSLFQDEH